MKNQIILTLVTAGILGAGIFIIDQNYPADANYAYSVGGGGSIKDTPVAPSKSNLLVKTEDINNTVVKEVVNNDAAPVKPAPSVTKTDTIKVRQEEITQNAPEKVVATIYKNGNFKSSPVTYFVPGGRSDTIAVTVTIDNDIVTALSVEGTASNRDSSSYHNRFERAIESVVIGQSVDSISPTRVGGASLTTAAFNKALAQAKLQAKS